MQCRAMLGRASAVPSLMGFTTCETPERMPANEVHQLHWNNRINYQAVNAELRPPRRAGNREEGEKANAG